MKKIEFPIYGDEIIARLKSEDELETLDFIEPVGIADTIWLAEDTDYNMIEAQELEAKVKGKKMLIYIIKLNDGSVIVEGKKRR